MSTYMRLTPNSDPKQRVQKTIVFNKEVSDAVLDFKEEHDIATFTRALMVLLRDGIIAQPYMKEIKKRELDEKRG